MMAQWLPGDCETTCFIDNNQKLWGTALEGVPVLSFDQALGQGLDAIVVAVINREAACSVTQQIVDAGFEGEIIGLDTFRTWQDVRLATLRLCAADVLARDVEGAVAELGVYQGAFAKEINRLFPDRTLYLFDTFSGFTDDDMGMETQVTGQSRFRDFSDTSVEAVRAVLPFPERAVFVPGWFPDSAKGLSEERFALVSLDPDLYEPTKEGLLFFWPRLAVGGRILIHDYTSMQFPGVKVAVDAFCEERGLFVTPLMDLHGTAVLVKQGC